MNGAQIHLLLNHLPVLVPLIGTLLLAIGLIAKPTALRETGAWLLSFGALSVIPVYLTGDRAESVIKNYPDVSRLLISDHRNAALLSLSLLLAVGALSLVFIFGSRTRKRFASNHWAWSVLFILTLISFGFMARTAHLGGLIRHEEIRSSDRF